MPSIVQIFVVGGERKRRLVEGTAAAAISFSAARCAGLVTTTSAAGKNEEPPQQQQQEQGQESDRGGRADASVVFYQDQAAIVPRRPADPPRSTICPSSSSSVHATSTPVATSTPTSTGSSSATTTTPAGSGEKTSVLVDHTMLVAVLHQQEEERKAQDDFDSLFDDQHVFGIPYDIGKGNDFNKEISTAAAAAASSHDDEGLNPLGDMVSPIIKRKNKDNSEGFGEISANDSTTNTQQSGNIHDVSYTRARRRKEADTIFEERFNQLLQFKEEFGHCNVPIKYSENPSLGQWCSSLKSMYNRIQNGVQSRILSKVRIERLEQIGFLWRVLGPVALFNKRCCQLIAFRDEFGHCNVPQKYKANKSLGTWCQVMRTSYSKIQKGLINNSCALSHEWIERLEEIGFQWEVYNYDAEHIRKPLSQAHSI